MVEVQSERGRDVRERKEEKNDRERERARAHGGKEEESR